MEDTGFKRRVQTAPSKLSLKHIRCMYGETKDRLGRYKCGALPMSTLA